MFLEFKFKFSKKEVSESVSCKQQTDFLDRTLEILFSTG